MSCATKLLARGFLFCVHVDVFIVSELAVWAVACTAISAFGGRWTLGCSSGFFGVQKFTVGLGAIRPEVARSRGFWRVVELSRVPFFAVRPKRALTLAIRGRVYSSRFCSTIRF
jgi:hypothetical protein